MVISWHPGEQAVYNKESGEVTVANIDVSYVTAWREGRLRFRDRPLKEIMVLFLVGMMWMWYMKMRA